MKKCTLLSILLLPTAVVTAATNNSPMEDCSRKGKWDVYGFGESLMGWEQTTLSGGAASFKFDSGFGGGIGLGYNVIDNLNINAQFAGAWMDTTARLLVPSPLPPMSGTASALLGSVGLDYNIFKKRFTPLVNGNVGFVYFNGDFGTPGSDFSETDIFYGAGGGVRWDITDNWFLKAVYRVNWVSLQDSDNTTMFHTVTVGVGYSF